MSKIYKVKKGTEIVPFAYRELEDPDTSFEELEWRVVTIYRGEPLLAIDDWYFTDDDFLPYPYDKPPKSEVYYVKLSIMTQYGNAFSVHRKEVEEVS